MEEQGYVSETPTELYEAAARIMQSEINAIDAERDQSNLESWIASGGH